MNRQKDMFSQPQQPSLSEMVEGVESAAVPPSSLPSIPQSSVRLYFADPSRKSLQSAVQATPTRKLAPQSLPASNLPSVSPAGYGGYLPSSPLQPRRSDGDLFAIPDSVTKATSRSAMTRGIQETPVKKRVEVTPVHSHPAPTTGSNKENGRRESSKVVTNVGIETPVGSSQEESIYKSLGWDGDDLDELS